MSGIIPPHDWAEQQMRKVRIKMMIFAALVGMVAFVAGKAL